MDSPAAGPETPATPASPQALPDSLLEELRGVVGLLLDHVLDHVAGDSAPSSEAGKALLDLKERLQRAGEPAEVLAARERIAGLLTALTQAKQAQALSIGIAAKQEDPAQSLESTAPSDDATGLPLQAEAEAAIRRALSGTTPAYLAMFSVERMALIGSRFGDAVADQVLMLCSQHLASRLIKPKDALFRWKGPSFAALLERSASITDTSTEVQRFLAIPTNQYFDLKHRTVYMPIKMTGEVIVLADLTYEQAMKKVEQFAGASR